MNIVLDTTKAFQNSTLICSLNKTDLKLYMCNKYNWTGQMFYKALHTYMKLLKEEIEEKSISEQIDREDMYFFQ